MIKSNLEANCDRMQATCSAYNVTRSVTSDETNVGLPAAAGPGER